VRGSSISFFGMFDYVSIYVAQIITQHILLSKPCALKYSNNTIHPYLKNICRWFLNKTTCSNIWTPCGGCSAFDLIRGDMIMIYLICPVTEVMDLFYNDPALLEKYLSKGTKNILGA